MKNGSQHLFNCLLVHHRDIGYEVGFMAGFATMQSQRNVSTLRGDLDADSTQRNPGSQLRGDPGTPFSRSRATGFQCKARKPERAKHPGLIWSHFVVRLVLIVTSWP